MCVDLTVEMFVYYYNRRKSERAPHHLFIVAFIVFIIKTNINIASGLYSDSNRMSLLRITHNIHVLFHFFPQT